jgi:hypothetical protein
VPPSAPSACAASCGAFYVKQIETGGAGEFDRMSDEELRAFVYGNEKPAKSKH